MDNINGNRHIKIENDLKYMNSSINKKNGEQSPDREAQNTQSSPLNESNEANFSSIDNNENDVIRQRRLDRFKSQE